MPCGELPSPNLDLCAGEVRVSASAANALTRCEPRPCRVRWPRCPGWRASLLLRATLPVRTLSPPQPESPTARAVTARSHRAGACFGLMSRGGAIHARGSARVEPSGTMWGVGGGSGWSGLSRSKRLATRSSKWKPARLAACKRVAAPTDSPSDAPAKGT
jgi:hypothetical protein